MVKTSKYGHCYVVPVKPIKSNLRKPNFINKFLSTSGHTDSNIVQSKKDEKKGKKRRILHDKVRKRNKKRGKQDAFQFLSH